MAAWYKCSACQVLIQGIQQFVVHNFKHQFKDDDDNDTTVQSGGQLFYPEPGVGYPLNELPSQHTTGIFAPRIQLMSIEESSANFIVEIKSPSVLLPFVGTGEPELRLPLVPDYTTLDSYDKNGLDHSKDEVPQNQTPRHAFYCNFCHHQVTSSKSLSSHIQECLKGPNASRLYCCPIELCDYSKGFSSPDLIWNHFAQYHQLQARSRCDTCQQAFPTVFALGHHQNDTTCVSRTVSELKEELDVITRLCGKIERVPMVYCSFCQLRLKKRFLSGHHVTCHKKLLCDGRSVRFRCPFSQCPARFNNRGEVAPHFHSSCHSHMNIDVRNRLVLKLQRKMELLSYTQADVGILVPKNPHKSTAKETRSKPSESDPDGGYSFKLWKEKNGRVRKFWYKKCRTCGKVNDSRNFARHQRTCKDNRRIGKGFTRAVLKSLDIRSFFKSTTPSTKPENGKLKLDNDSVSSPVPNQYPVTVKKEIDAGVNLVEDSKQTSTKVVSGVKVGLTSTIRRLKSRKYKRPEQMKQCPFCSLQLRPSNFARHCIRCKRTSRTSKKQSITSSSTTFEKQLPSIKVESTHDEAEAENTNFEQEKVSEVFDETSPQDVNSSEKQEMNVVDQDDEKVPTVSSHSRKKIASLRAKARGKIQMQFKTRCRYCDIQITTKCLAKHLSRCKVKKSMDQERNIVTTEKERDVTIVQTETVDEQNPEAKQSQDSRSWLANWTSTADCAILTDSKFRPRSTCPICKTVQTSGSLTTHMQKCALNSPIVTSSPKNEPQQPAEVFEPVTDREDLEQKQSTPASSILKTQVTEETKTKKPTVPKNKQLKKCPSCRRFVRASNLDEHRRKRCGRVTPKCDVPCPKPGCKIRLTSNPFSLSVHLRVHHDDNLTCDICNRTFTVKASFRKHFYRSICGRALMSIGSEEKKSSAGSNSVIASRKILATSKLRIGKAKIQPQIDSSTIITANVGENEPSQQLIVDRFDRIPCQECGTVMFRKSIMKHLRVCKGRKNVEPEVEISQTSLMVCTEMGCDSLFLSSEELRNHVEQYHVKKVNYLCSNCKKLFVETLSNISQHRKTCQSIGTKKPNLASSSTETVVRPGQLKRVAIKIVSDTSSTPTLLPKPKPPSPKKTKSTPTKLKPNECDMCGNCYNTASGLQQHKQRHCMKKSARAASQWKCIFCMQGFVTPADLKDHIRNRCHLRRSDGNTIEHDPLTLPMTSETSNGFANDAGSTSDMKCGYCHTYFSTRKALMEHFRTPCTLPSNGVSHGQIKMDPDGFGADAVRIKMEDDLIVDGIVGGEVEQDPLDDESIY